MVRASNVRRYITLVSFLLFDYYQKEEDSLHVDSIVLHGYFIEDCTNYTFQVSNKSPPTDSELPYIPQNLLRLKLLNFLISRPSPYFCTCSWLANASNINSSHSRIKISRPANLTSDYAQQPGRCSVYIEPAPHPLIDHLYLPRQITKSQSPPSHSPSITPWAFLRHT